MTILNATVLAAALIFIPPFFISSGTAFSPDSIVSRFRPTDALTPIAFRPAVAVTRSEPLEGIVKEWTAFDQETFTQKTLRVVKSEAGAERVYTAQIPGVGIGEVDKVIEGQTTAFLSSLSGGSAPGVAFTSHVRVFDAYVYVTLSSPQHPSFLSFGVDEDGLVDAKKVSDELQDGTQALSEEQMIDIATTTLTQRFPQTQREDMQKAVKKALEKKSYRAAKNGLVLIIPAEDMVGTTISMPFHEVLVPTSL